MSKAMNELGEHIQGTRPDDVLSWDVSRGELTVYLDPARLVAFVEFIRTDNNCKFSSLVDITAVDYPTRSNRFELVYHFLSMYQNHRIRLKCAVAEDSSIASISAVHPSAGWFEREVFDMFGILFSGHADLRRLLTDYGFCGHPLRKDFPTTGYVEVRYDALEKRVIYEPVSLVQEYRQFDSVSPWEGANYNLSGDEDAKEGAK